MKRGSLSWLMRKHLALAGLALLGLFPWANSSWGLVVPCYYYYPILICPTNFYFLDAADRGCNSKGQCSQGMVSWSVSEPYLNLWLADEPVGYTTSLGEHIGFQVFYKQRDTSPPNQNKHQKWFLSTASLEGGDGVAMGTLPEPPVPPTFVPPTGWNHNWFSYIRFAGVYHLADPDATDYTTNIWQDFGNWKATLYVAGGGAIDFASGMSFMGGDNPNNARNTGCNLYPMNGNNQHVYPATTNGTTFVPNGGVNVPGQVGFRLVYTDGSMDLFGKVTALYSGSALADALLTERVDASGNRMRFYYTNYSVGGVMSYFLKHVVDYDGKTNTLTYNSSNLVSRVDTPYGRYATFDYNTAGRLIKITDAVGLESEMAYDAGTKEPTWLKTPYGETWFEITDNGDTQGGQTVGDAGGTNRIARAIRITHPNESKELYVYRFESDQVGIPETLTGQVPYSPIGNLDTGTVSNRVYGLHRRNTFHWSRRQYELLSTNVITALKTNDYKLATMTHWLADNDKFLGDQPGLIQEGSPDGGTMPGRRTWFDYAGKAAQHLTGSGAGYAVCELLPDGNTRYDWTTADDAGNPLTKTSTYETPDGDIGLRTYNFNYENTSGSETCADIYDTTISSINWPVTLLSSISGPESETILSLSSSVAESLTNTVTTNGVTYTYVTTRPQRRELAVTDAASRTANVWFNGRQQVIGARLFNDVVLTNFYGGDGWLAQTINLSAGATNSLSFTNGLLLARTNAVGLVTRYAWDNLERLNTVRFPDETGLTNIYQKLHLWVQQDRLGHSTWFNHNPEGELTSITDPLSRETEFTYCFCGALETVTDPLHISTTYAYDYNGRLLSETDADSFARSYHRNAFRQITNITDTAGNNLTLLYNHQGLVKQANNLTGMLYQVVYDKYDRPLTVTNAYGAGVTNTYDYLHRLLTRRVFNDTTTHTETLDYSNLGLRSRTDAEQRVTWFGYDPAGRLNAVTNANEDVISATFNPLGRMLSLTDGRNKTTRWLHDIYGRTLAETNANNTLTRTNAYDANGQLVKRWTPAKGLTTYFYDAVGNVTNLVSSNRTVTIKFDALDRWTNVTDAAGTLARSFVSFGAFKRGLATVDGPWANDTYTLHRLSDRKVDAATLQELNVSGGASARTWNFNYDGLNRLKQWSGTAGSFTFDYAGAGQRLITTHLPGGNSISNVFDPAGQLLERWLKNSAGSGLDAYLYQQDLTGWRTNVVRGDGTHAEYVFDGIGQLTNAVAFEPDGALRKNEDFDYTYDAAGNLETRVNHTLTQTFSVNDANQLSTATRSGTLTAAGQANSLVQTVTVNGQPTELYTDRTFATTNGLTLSSGTNVLAFTATDAMSHSTTVTQIFNLPATVSYLYDLNGNLTSDGALGYDYDDADQLTRITKTNEWKSEFTYDALGRRIARREYTYDPTANSYLLSAEVRYVWLGMSVVQERDGNNAVKVTYTGKLAREDAALGTTSYFFTDGNGNVSSLINASGNVKAKYRYDSFGNLLAKSGPLADVNLIRFSGKEQHPRSGLYYYGYRYYAPNLQRWMNQDPIGIAGGMNLYGFVGNDPINFIDASGLDRKKREEIERKLEELYKNDPDLSKDGSKKQKDDLEDEWFKDQADEMSHTTEADGFANKMGRMAVADKAYNELEAMRARCKKEKLSPETEARHAVQSGMETGPGMGVVAAGVLASKPKPSQPAQPDCPPPAKKGVVYKVPGEDTPSGKDYVGRTTHPDGPPGRGNKDGRDRTKAEIVDEYSNTREGKAKEQRAIDEGGGVDNLDNKRNEIAPDKREDYGLDQQK